MAFTRYGQSVEFDIDRVPTGLVRQKRRFELERVVRNRIARQQTVLHDNLQLTDARPAGIDVERDQVSDDASIDVRHVYFADVENVHLERTTDDQLVPEKHVDEGFAHFRRNVTDRPRAIAIVDHLHVASVLRRTYSEAVSVQTTSDGLTGHDNFDIAVGVQRAARVDDERRLHTDLRLGEAFAVGMRWIELVLPFDDLLVFYEEEKQ